MNKSNLCFSNYEPPQSNVLGVFSEGVLCTSGNGYAEDSDEVEFF